MKKSAIIVAGGKGLRMGGEVPKQYLPIAGIPVLMHTLSVFFKTDPEIHLVLVIPKGDFEFWDNLCQIHQFQIKHELVAGGDTRFQSVRNGLNSLPEEVELVAIHDGVRPFVSPQVIQNSYVESSKTGSAIAVIACKDSIRKINAEGESTFQERQYFRLVQTPQTFRLDKLKKAFDVPEIPQFTDDATVYEHQGWQVSLIEGNLENIKITTPDDLDFAEFIATKANVSR
jgi:2-C-methyl-D-erythritol 4-phosphate cytidylyltransferase